MPSSPRPSPDVISQELEDEMVLVHLPTNRIFALNATGARFWQLLEEGRDADGIREALVREFDVDPGQLDEEIGALVAALAAEGLLEPAG